MFNNILKILVLLIIFSINPSYSKIENNTDFKVKNLSSYFSALISFENQQNQESLKFFFSSRPLIHFHEPYLRRYLNSLVQDGKIKKAANELRAISNKKSKDFFEAYLLLYLDSIKRQDYNKGEEYLKKLEAFKETGAFERVIVISLRDFFYMYKNKKIKNLSLIHI